MATAVEPELLRSVQCSCLCGKSNHDITLPTARFPLPAYMCHCTSCRHTMGTLVDTLAISFGPELPTKAKLDNLQAYDMKKRLRVYFCPTCGTKMLLRILNPENLDQILGWGIPTGSFDKATPDVLDFQCHEHIQDTLDGGFADFLPAIAGKELPRWSAWPDMGEQLPPFKAGDIAAKHTGTRDPSDLLHAHCHCNALSFWISRPSTKSERLRAQWPDALVAYTSPEPLPPDTETWWLRANGTKYLAANCACDSCRLAAGMEWIQYAFIPRTNLWKDAQATMPLALKDVGCLKEYRSSSNVSRYFCGGCGVMAFWAGDDRPDVIDVAVGLLDAVEGARAESWLEWGWKRVSFAEYGMKRAPEITRALEEGLKEYGKVARERP